MYDLIEQSKKMALIRQGWYNGEGLWRVGNPYEWVAGDNTGIGKNIATGKAALLSYMTAYFGEFNTPKEFYIEEFEEVKTQLFQKLSSIFKLYFPYKDKSDFDYYLKSMSHVRTQDYAFLKVFCPLKEKPNHLDLGPGLGSHALYSLGKLDSIFYAVDASPISIVAQYDFFYAYLLASGLYLNTIDVENMTGNLSLAKNEINTIDKYKIKHIPSWHFDLVDNATIDLVSATWMLNEVSYSSILWLLANVSRVLKKDAFFYIRDSAKLKPGCHNLDYDSILQQLDFELIHISEVINLKDYYGIPRLYQKRTNKFFTWKNLVDKFLPQFASVVTGGGKETGEKFSDNTESNKINIC